MSISAHSLFEFYERCGMQSVVDETIFVNTQAGMNEMGIMTSEKCFNKGSKVTVWKSEGRL